ncbi:uncharacterized protein LOC118461969 [Anopheles albimanus]|uniref:uncharacterized protein LOC118461969 n=1 Tax=Anopheles albimanus TaxID=7167 RepID=UPI00163F8137|nr:uncharacterized protein LOC118461969 [Anopheles albimanus]
MESDYNRKYMWTRELIFRLIDELKANPLLWHQGHEDFKKRKKKLAVLQRIANNLQIPLNCVRFKIDVLKGTFHKYRRFIERDGAEHKKLWFAYQRLSFLAKSGPMDACAPSEYNETIAKREVPSPPFEPDHTATDTFIPPSNSTIHQQNDTNWIPPPVHQSTVTDNAVPDNAAIIVEGLLKVIADGTNSRRTWSEAMASYVAVMLQQAGERSPAEMRLFHRKLIFLVESYQDGTLTEQ